MAEGLLRASAGDRYEVVSAGTEPAASVHLLAVKAMAEIGIDISTHRAKAVEQFLTEAFDWVITVCDQAREACPVFPNARNSLHWSIPDPARFEGSEEETAAEFRRARDLLSERLDEWLAAQCET